MAANLPVTHSVSESSTKTDDTTEKSTEVRPRRRRFTQAEKITIIEEYEACDRGQRGLYLRQKGLHSSVVYTWRKALGSGEGLAPQVRGRKPRGRREAVAENAVLRRQLARAEESIRQMQLIIDVQKKVSQILGVTLPEIAKS